MSRARRRARRRRQPDRADRVDSRRWCATAKKKKYFDIEEARVNGEMFARHHMDETFDEFRVYKCHACGAWHLTRKPLAQ